MRKAESTAGDAKLLAMAAPCVRGDILALLPYAFLVLLLPPSPLFFNVDGLLLLSDTTAALLLFFAVDAPRRGDDLLCGVRVVDVGLAALVGVGLIIFQPFWKITLLSIMV
jgi:hypothetical protein